MASGDGPGPEPGRLRRRGVLVESGARRVAYQAGRVHQDLAPSLVRAQARQAPVVQGLLRHPKLHATWCRPSGHLPHRQGRRGYPPQALRLRALLQPGHHVLPRRLRQGEGGVDQLDRTVHSAALAVGHRFRGRRLR